MASTPVAPPPAAPAATSASAASSQPSTPATPTPSTPVSSVSTPVETTTPAVETPSTPAAPAKPEQKDFEGVQEYLDEVHKWDREHPEDLLQPPDEPVAAAEEPEYKPKDDVDPEAAKKAVEADEDKPWAEKPLDATPETVSNWAKENPLLEQAWNANPALKNQMHAMARQNAKLAPMGKIFPNEKAAQYASETSTKWVGLENAFSNAAINPESIGDAADIFYEQFMVRDDKGQPVLDASGSPTFHEDAGLFTRHVTDNALETYLDRATEAYAASKSDDAEVLVNALKYVKDYIAKDGKIEAPAKENLTPEQRAWQERMESDLAEREKRLGIDSSKTKLEGKAGARESYELQVKSEINGVVGKNLDNFFKEKKDAGIFIPSYVLNMKDPASGKSALAVAVLHDFHKKVEGVSYYKSQFEGLQRLAPSDSARQQRVDLAAEAVNDFLPDIINDHLDRMQKSHMEDVQARKAQRDGQTPVAQTEPAGGSTITPSSSAMNDTDRFSQAMAEARKKFPDAERKELNMHAMTFMRSGRF